MKDPRTLELLVHLSMMAVQSAAHNMQAEFNQYSQAERTIIKEEYKYEMISRDQDDLLDIVFPADFCNEAGHIDFFPLLFDKRCPEFIDNFIEAMEVLSDVGVPWLDEYEFLMHEVIWKAYWAFNDMSRSDVIGYLLESGDIMDNDVLKLYGKKVR